MAPSGQGFGLLDIGAIFLVVFALMYAGVQLSKGDLLPADTTTPAEEAVRAEMWTAIDERREARGLDRMPSDRFVRGVAEDTTESLAAASERTDTTEATPRLTNHRLFCSQVPVSVSAENRSTRAVAADLVTALDDSPRRSVLYRPSSRFRTGIGVALLGDSAVAVVRSCEQVDT